MFNRWFGLIVWIAVCFMAAGLGSAFTSSSLGEWYRALRKPSWNPPNWVFGPVWSLLYLSMGVAAWMVWSRKGFAQAAVPLTLFLAQLALNAAWSWFFFGQRIIGAAFAEIVLLWGAILATLIAFWRVTPAAGGLMIPYLLWVTFAAVLNFAIWRLNAP